MKHRHCGGNISQDWNFMYQYEGINNVKHSVPALRCEKCGKVILGDGEIDTEVPEIEEQYEELKHG